jgi:hypothetical protein
LQKVENVEEIVVVAGLYCNLLFDEENVVPGGEKRFFESCKCRFSEDF